jgi:DNA-binding XRE family transcriptional regulator
MKKLPLPYTEVMEITKLFALNLRKNREGKGMSADSLGEKMTPKVTGKHIYDVEKERKKPSIDFVIEAAKALDVSVSDLFKEEERREKPLKVSEALQKMMSIPDDVYDLAAKLPIDDGAWEGVKGVLQGAINAREYSKKSNHS